MKCCCDLFHSGVDNFPQVQKYHTDSPTPSEMKKPRKAQEYNHDTEIIFSLPCLQLTLKTDHFQGEKEPGPEGTSLSLIRTYLYCASHWYIR